MTTTSWHFRTLPTLPDHGMTTTPPSRSDNSNSFSNPLETGVVFLLMFIFFIVVSISVTIRRRKRLRLLMAAAAEREVSQRPTPMASPTRSVQSAHEQSNDLNRGSTAASSVHIGQMGDDELSQMERRRSSNYDEPPDYDSVAAPRNSIVSQHSVGSVARSSFSEQVPTRGSVVGTVEEEDPPSYEDVVSSSRV